MKQAVIIGAGGFGREMLAWVRQSSSGYSVKGFLDDNLLALDGFPKDVPILGRPQDYEPGEDEVFVCAMGRVENKRACMERILGRGGVFINIVHLSAVIGENIS